MENSTDDIKNQTFEQAINELEIIVKKLERGQDSLEEAISLYERAHLLKNYCVEKLEHARFKIDKITKKNDGALEIVEEIL